MILPYQVIMREKPIINPVERTELIKGGMKFTHGCGPAGYDLRLDLSETTSSSKVLWPNDFRLYSAIEEFEMPNDIIGMVHDKSSWIRRGISVHNTVIEPGWKGFLTLEIKNVGDQSVNLIHGVGICQVVFHRLEQASERPYQGKYQRQAKGPQPAI